MQGKICDLAAFAVLLSFATHPLAQDLCDPTNGASGNGTYCMLIPNYDTYQKAECGRPPFITSSNKTETCADSCRDYCWLPCMVKEFDQRNGTVDPVCACQGDTDQMCEHPTGSVKYYTECLNVTAPCPSLAYADFADFYFNWLSSKIANGTSCQENEDLRAFKLCVENDVRRFESNFKFGTCRGRNNNFRDLFDACGRTKLTCPSGFADGIELYTDTFLNGTVANANIQYMPTYRCSD